MPFERIQTLLADQTHHGKFKNTRQAFQFVYVNYGYRELFRGAIPVLWRNGPSNALFFIMREEAATLLPHRVRFPLAFGIRDILEFHLFFSFSIAGRHTDTIDTGVHFGCRYRCISQFVILSGERGQSGDAKHNRRTEFKY